MDDVAKPPDAWLAARLEQIGSAGVFAAAGAAASAPWQLRPLASSTRVAGRAHTVRFAPGDNRALWRAMESIGPDSVLIAVPSAEQAGSPVALWGDVLTRLAIGRGVRGLVLDGHVRDSAAIVALGFPVFCRGCSPRGPIKADEGQLASPVLLAGLEVAQSDWVVADEDGVACVPADAVDAALADARAVQDREQRLVDETLARWKARAGAEPPT